MRTDEWTWLIDHLTTLPSMWVGRADYEHIASFICGYDYACGGALLAGFREWLTMRYGRGHNLAWFALIRSETLGDFDRKDGAKDSNDETLLTELRQLLIEFLRHREAIGLRNAYYDHGKWIRQFDWFDENAERRDGSPDGPRGTGQDGERKPPMTSEVG